MSERINTGGEFYSAINGKKSTGDYKSAPGIFENRGRKVDEDRIRMEKDREIARLKATIAEVVQENLEIKKRIGERLRRRGQI